MQRYIKQNVSKSVHMHTRPTRHYSGFQVYLRCKAAKLCIRSIVRGLTLQLLLRLCQYHPLITSTDQDVSSLRIAGVRFCFFRELKRAQTSNNDFLEHEACYRKSTKFRSKCAHFVEVPHIITAARNEFSRPTEKINHFCKKLRQAMD